MLNLKMLLTNFPTPHFPLLFLIHSSNKRSLHHIQQEEREIHIHFIPPCYEFTKQFFVLPLFISHSISHLTWRCYAIATIIHPASYFPPSRLLLHLILIFLNKTRNLISWMSELHVNNWNQWEKLFEKETWRAPPCRVWKKLQLKFSSWYEKKLQFSSPPLENAR